MEDIELIQNVTFLTSARIVERFPRCHCVYFKHAVQPYPACSRHDHEMPERVVLVGYACPRHSEKYRGLEQGEEVTANSELV